MKQLKRFLFGAAMLTFALSACNGSKDQTDGGGGDKGAPIADEPAELVFYSNNGNSEESFNQSFGDALRKKYPHYTITYIQAKTGTTLPEMLASGTKFDIFFATIGNFERYLMESKLEFDMRELIVKHRVDLNGLDPVYVNYMKSVAGGPIYGFPIQNNVMVLYYNKAIFQKFGVPFPKDGMTWEDAIEIAKKLNRNDGGKQYIGLSVNPANTMNQNQFSLSSVDPKSLAPTINRNASWKTIFETLFIRPAQDEGVRAEIARQKKIPDHYTFVRDQSLAMYGYSSGLISALANELRLVDWDIVSLPTFRELPGVGAQPYPIEMGITSLSTKKDAAMLALKFLISDEYQETISKQGIMPVLTKNDVKKAFGTESEFKEKHLSSVFYNKMAPIAEKAPPYGAAADKLYANAVLPLAQGQIDMNSSFRSADEQADKAIKELQQGK